MTKITPLKLLIIFAVALSLSSLPGPLASHFVLPFVPTVRADPAAAQTWVPAGPAMDTQIVNIFQDQGTEYAALTQANPSIDIMDWRLTPAQVNSLNTDPRFAVTSQVTEQGYDEIEFHLDNNYWGINFNFGNDPNGVQIRQGIAHLIDRSNFAAVESDIAGSAPIDEPFASGASFGGVTFQAPNSCLWDSQFPGSAPVCTQASGPPGGTAYNCVLSQATCPGQTLGAVAPNTWQVQIGSGDFCAAATHIMNALNGGVFISGHGVKLNANCELLAPGQTTVGTGWPTNVTNNKPNIFVRLDDAPRLSLGNSYAQEICALWTGQYSTGCDPYLSVTPGTITSFCGFFTSTSGISDCWWMYTAAFSAFPIDGSLFFGYNSQFVSGGSWDHPSCSGNTPTPSANNYEYVCNLAYDSASKGVEFPADNTVGTAFANAKTASDIFGKNVFTIPAYTQRDQAAYLKGFQRVQNSLATSALAIGQLSWLDAWTQTPATGPAGCPNTPGLSTGNCFREGFKQPTRSLSQYIASTVWDAYILDDVYDTLGQQNPANLGQVIDWMTIRDQELSNAALGYTPPAGTTDNFRFTLRNDLFWQDGHKVTAWDVQMSFASLLANGAFSGAGLAPLLPPSGFCNNSPPVSNGNCADQITVLSPTQFDVHLYQHGPFTRLGLMVTPVLPGRYWTSLGLPYGSSGSAAWDSCVAAASCPVSAMSADPSKLGFTYDPIQNGIFIGAGAWECISTGVSTPAGTLGSGCSSTGLENPPPGGSYTLTRNGLNNSPQSTNQYFRGSGSIALYLWSGNTGDSTGDPINFSALAACVGKPTVPLGQVSGCGHWQQGIGANGGPSVIGGIQASITLRFIFVNWVAPFNLSNNRPDNLVAFPPVLYHGGTSTTSTTLNPATGASGVGCNSPYPVGGYDC